MAEILRRFRGLNIRIDQFKGQVIEGSSAGWPLFADKGEIVLLNDATIPVVLSPRPTDLSDVVYIFNVGDELIPFIGFGSLEEATYVAAGMWVYSEVQQIIEQNFFMFRENLSSEGAVTIEPVQVELI